MEIADYSTSDDEDNNNSPVIPKRKMTSSHDNLRDSESEPERVLIKRTRFTLSSSDEDEDDAYSSTTDDDSGVKSTPPSPPDIIQELLNLNAELLEKNERLKNENLAQKQRIQNLENELEELKKNQKKSRLKTPEEKKTYNGMGTKAKHTTVGQPFDPDNPEYQQMVKDIRMENDGCYCHCEKKFTTKRWCVEHIQNLHFNRQHPCKVCPYISSTSDGLHKHIKRCHTERTKIPLIVKTVLYSENRVIKAIDYNEEAHDDNVYTHWVCKFKENSETKEPLPHLYASGFHLVSGHHAARTVVGQLITQAKKKNATNKRVKFGCGSLRKMMAIGFHLDIETLQDSGVYSVGHMTADEVKPCVRYEIYATKSRDHLDDLDKLDKGARAHLKETLVDFSKEGEDQRDKWNVLSRDNIHVLVTEALNKPFFKSGTNVTKIIQYIEESRRVSAQFLQEPMEDFIIESLLDESIIFLDDTGCEFKLNIV